MTLLPPKKYFFPQRETLFTYDLADGFSAKNPEEAKPMVIIGVHPYDIVALLHMDEIFRETKSDPYYFKKREILNNHRSQHSENVKMELLLIHGLRHR